MVPRVVSVVCLNMIKASNSPYFLPELPRRRRGPMPLVLSERPSRVERCVHATVSSMARRDDSEASATAGLREFRLTLLLELLCTPAAQ